MILANRRVQTWCATAVTAFLVASTLLAVAAAFDVGLGVTDLALFPVVIAFAVGGWVLAERAPAPRIGWLLLMTAAGFLFIPWSVIALWMLRHGVGGADLIAGFASCSFVLDVGGVALLLPLMFPDGRLPSTRRRWRLVLGADLGYLLFAAVNLFTPGAVALPQHVKVPNPFGLPHAKHLVNTVIGVSAPCLVIGVVGSLAAVVVRLRDADPGRRAQMKWVLVAFLLTPGPFILHDYVQWLSDILLTIVLPIVPVAIAIAVLRYRLYEIDRILSRTVTYLLVTGTLAGLYLGCVAMTTSLLPVGSSVGVAASTLAAAAGFRPLRRRVQARVDHRFNRTRYDAARMVDSFAVQLRDQVDPDLVRTGLLDVAARSLQPAHASLWLAP